MGQGQPRVISWTTLVVLPYMMLHTKFQGHRSSGSGEEDFLRFLPYMGMAAMLVMWPRPFEQFFFPKGPGGCIWNLVAIGPVVSEEKSFEIVDGRRTDGRTDDGRTTEPSHPISSPGAFGSGELKKCHLKLEFICPSVTTSIYTCGLSPIHNVVCFIWLLQRKLSFIHCNLILFKSYCKGVNPGTIKNQFSCNFVLWCQF